MKVFICGVCGHIAFDEVLDNCPVCYAFKDKFTRNDNVFNESQEKSPEVAIKHIPDIIVEISDTIGDAKQSDVAVRIGKDLHPMEEKHFINFIDCYLDNKFIERVQYSSYAVRPESFCYLKQNILGNFSIVAKCNVHGYWLASEEIK